MSVKKRKGRFRYRCVVQRPDGSKERIYGTRDTHAEAKQAEHDHRDRVQRPWLYKRRKEAPVFGTFFEDVILDVYVKGKGNKPSEIAAKKNIFKVHLRPRFGSKRIDEIDYDAVEALKAAMGGLSGKRKNNVLTVLNVTLKEAQKRGYLETLPLVQFVKVPKQAFDYLEDAEMDRLVIGAHEEGADIEAAILVGGDAGGRVGEVRALDWRYSDVVARRITFAQGMSMSEVTSTKGDNVRHVPMTERLVSALGRIQGLSRIRGDSVPVFRWPDGSRWTRTETDTKLWRACRRAGLREIGWHTLRHTFASRLVMRGVSLKQVQELLGHSDIRQTMRYAHLAPGAAEEAIRAFEAPRRGTGVAPQPGQDHG